MKIRKNSQIKQENTLKLYDKEIDDLKETFNSETELIENNKNNIMTFYLKKEYLKIIFYQEAIKERER